MIRIDTHTAFWLYSNRSDELTAGGRRLIDDEEVMISPVVELELTVLFEIGRFAVDGRTIVEGLVEAIGARRSPIPFATVVNSAHRLGWTRDPFDRLITADAIAADCQLLTDDDEIHRHCDLAVW